MPTPLKDKLEKLKGSPPSYPANYCIYRVPERLRQINKKAYTPQVVSIGPLHHGVKHLKLMEEQKLRYMLEFLDRTKISLQDLVNLLTMEKEQKLRSCYAEEIKFDHDKFVEIILVDATFIIEVLLRYSFPKLKKENDHIFDKPYLIQDIWYDMWLLENQLPFFFLRDLYEQPKVSESILSCLEAIQETKKPTLIELTYKFFKILEAVKGKLEKVEAETENVKHFTDFLRICHLPAARPTAPREKIVTTAPSLTQLQQAGVKFQLNKSKDSFDIKFDKGTLQIPPLKLQLETESLFRNLIAFEQRHYSANYINDYIFIIHHLLNTPKDVELLDENKIIENWLPDKRQVSTLINNLSRGATLDPEKFYFSSLCEDLEAYCGKRLNRYRAILLQNYFQSPWSIISVIAAVFLLLLTVTQTVFSVLQVESQPNNC